MIAISKYNKQHPLRVFEAFAGYGSQSLAFKYLKDKNPEFDFKSTPPRESLLLSILLWVTEVIAFHYS